jgi:hypothetical protein
MIPAVGPSLQAGTGSKSAIGPASGKDVLVPPSARGGRWELHAGFGVRQAFDMSVRSSSRSLVGGIFSPSLADSDLLGQIGPIDGQGNRVYDDGFVNIGSQFNLTSFWGYEDAGQVRQSSRQWDPSQPWDSPGNQSLYLSRLGETGLGGYRRDADTGAEMFPYIEARRLWQTDGSGFWHEKGVSFGWGWVPARAGVAEALSVLRTGVVDEYYLYGVIPPSAPYTGPELPPGPLLDNIPSDRVESGASDGLSGRTATDVDFDLHTLSLGGIWRHAPEFGPQDAWLRLHGLDLQAGLALNHGKLSVESTTTVRDGDERLASFRDRASKSKFLPGIYLSLGATLDIGEQDEWLIYSAGRYDYAGSIRAESRHSSVEVELDGFSWTIGIGRSW